MTFYLIAHRVLYVRIDKSSFLQSHVKTMETQIEEEHTDMNTSDTCPKCEMSAPTDAMYCPHCGWKITDQKAPWWHLHRRMYDWVLKFAHHKHSMTALFGLSFAESSFFPVPPDVLLMPLCLGNRKKWLRYASVCSLASVLGAVFGFLIGWLLWTRGVDQLFYTYIPGFTQEVFDKVSSQYEKYNFWIVFTAGFTPIPFKVITVTAGVFGTGEGVGNPVLFFAVFLIASAVSRSARFFLVAGLMRKYGARITPFIDRYFNLLALVFTVLLIGGFVLIKWVSH